MLLDTYPFDNTICLGLKLRPTGTVKVLVQWSWEASLRPTDVKVHGEVQMWVCTHMLMCACDRGSCREPLQKNRGAGSSILSRRSKRSSWQCWFDASGWLAAAAATDLVESFHLDKDSWPYLAALCLAADVLASRAPTGSGRSERQYINTSHGVGGPKWNTCS